MFLSFPTLQIGRATSELQSRRDLVCRLLLEKKKGIIAALEKAVEDGMDIINLSLGSTVNSPDWPTSIAVNKAIEMGVAVVIANGNEGPGNWTVSSPATSVKALSVGASITEMDIPYLTIGLEKRQIPLNIMSGS